ncbi:sensor histidine kinase [Sphaerisporangium aureirubrum]|uniref:sensor histidine kinase n=1 Tax=Sphaerisporangium aureirubrum TaxID=1544736 RepID=UPI003625EAE5
MDVTRRLRARLAGRRVVDAAVVAACLVLTAFAVKGHWAAPPGPDVAFAGAAGGLAQWWRRRLPLLAAVAGAAAYTLSGNPGPLLAGVYSGASYAPRRHLLVPLVAGWAGFAGWSWLGEGRLTASDAVWAACVAVALTAAGVHTDTRRALAASWRERAESAEAERVLREEQARAAERTRIAREMHDVLAHKMSLIALHAGGLELTASGSSDRVRQGAALIRVTAREALHELRDVLGVLRADLPPTRDAPPGQGEPFTDLTSLVRASTDAGQHVELHDHAGPLPPAMARVVHRVVQEGLTNARKHAPGAPVTVTVDHADGTTDHGDGTMNHGDRTTDRGDRTVRVTVHNTLATAAPADLPGSGSGLVGLAERLRLVGGTLSSGPLGDEDGGWRLRADLPWLVHAPGERAGENAGEAGEAGVQDGDGGSRS